MTTESEANILSSTLDYLSRRRVFHFRNNTGAVKTEDRFIRFGAVGSPDIICVVGGTFVGVEVKAKGGNQSPYQKEFQGRLEQAGGVYLLVRSIDEAMDRIEKVLTILKK